MFFCFFLCLANQTANATVVTKMKVRSPKSWKPTFVCWVTSMSIMAMAVLAGSLVMWRELSFSSTLVSLWKTSWISRSLRYSTNIRTGRAWRILGGTLAPVSGMAASMMGKMEPWAMTGLSFSRPLKWRMPSKPTLTWNDDLASMC